MGGTSQCLPDKNTNDSAPFAWNFLNPRIFSGVLQLYDAFNVSKRSLHCHTFHDDDTEGVNVPFPVRRNPHKLFRGHPFVQFSVVADGHG